VAEILVQVENLKKHFLATGSTVLKAFQRKFPKDVPVVKAVDGVSFEIRRGECFGLVGESGSGKSTIGRCILNLIPPTSGRVSFDGRPVFNDEQDIHLSHREMLPLRRDMQIIFQDPTASLDPRMRIGDIVAEGIIKHRIASRREAETIAGDYLELCGINRSLIRHYPGEFSGGQKQRIGIARALALKPRFIVADEPLSALDVSVQSQVLNLMCSLREQFNLTFLFISHDLRTVEYFCDRIGVLYLGSLVEIGSTADVVHNPLHPYTRALFSSIPRETPDIVSKRIQLKGEIPNAINIPSGCKFHTRCPHIYPLCERSEPVMNNTGNGHFAACHRWREFTHGTLKNP
jgi:oligopeptide/dipeptide ABC transporter ATP-binding protein